MTPDMFAAEIEKRLPELVRDSALNRMTFLSGLAREFQDHIVEETIKTVMTHRYSKERLWTCTIGHV